MVRYLLPGERGKRGCCMIKLLQVEKTYEGAAGPVKALKGINLEIKRGEIYGIIGY